MYGVKLFNLEHMRAVFEKSNLKCGWQFFFWLSRIGKSFAFECVTNFVVVLFSTYNQFNFLAISQFF